MSHIEGSILTKVSACAQAKPPKKSQQPKLMTRGLLGVRPTAANLYWLAIQAPCATLLMQQGLQRLQGSDGGVHILCVSVSL
jgi:hypothetical protein